MLYMKELLRLAQGTMNAQGGRFDLAKSLKI